jgi:hypothetical protein
LIKRYEKIKRGKVSLILQIIDPSLSLKEIKRMYYNDEINFEEIILGIFIYMGINKEEE